MQVSLFSCNFTYMQKCCKIGNRFVGFDEPSFIIAEAGVNHNGRLDLALKLVDAVFKAGADAVKFQNFVTEEVIRKNAPKAAYQDRNIGKKKTQYQMLKELELTEKDTCELKKYCDKIGIIFLSTASDFDSLNILEKINVVAHKLASINIVCHPLIEAVAKTNKPLILSTGMATEKEVKEAVEVFKKFNKQKNNLILLQCNTNYPAFPQDQNLRAINILKKYTPIVGFSDHTEGQEIAIASVAMGAKVIERHFTLDKNMEGPDHKASMDPKEFSSFVLAIRKIESALGLEEKKPTGGELENIIDMRRSICASKNIHQGTIIRQSYLAYKRPGDGLLPIRSNLKKILGKKAKINIKADSNINLKDLF